MNYRYSEKPFPIFLCCAVCVSFYSLFSIDLNQGCLACKPNAAQRALESGDPPHYMAWSEPRHASFPPGHGVGAGPQPLSLIGLGHAFFPYVAGSGYVHILPPPLPMGLGHTPFPLPVLVGARPSMSLSSCGAGPHRLLPWGWIIWGWPKSPFYHITRSEPGYPPLPPHMVGWGPAGSGLRRDQELPIWSVGQKGWAPLS